MSESLASIDVTKSEESLENIVVKSRMFFTTTFPVFTLIRGKDQQGNRFYSSPILVYRDNAVLKDQIYLDHCRLLDDYLRKYTQFINTSIMKIDELMSYETVDMPCNDKTPKLITSSYHPLAVVKKAMDYNFLFEICPGHLGHRKNGTQCSRVKANGYWVDPPDDMKQELEAHFHNTSRHIDRRPSSIFCPECGPIYYSQGAKMINKIETDKA